jgi:hypothetical protein
VLVSIHVEQCHGSAAAKSVHFFDCVDNCVLAWLIHVRLRAADRHVVVSRPLLRPCSCWSLRESFPKLFQAWCCIVLKAASHQPAASLTLFASGGSSINCGGAASSSIKLGTPDDSPMPSNSTSSPRASNSASSSDSSTSSGTS